MSQWKHAERKIAEILGGKATGVERVPVTGRQRGSAPDITHPWLAIEVKHRTSLPGWMHSAMAQAEASKQGDQLPVVIYHQTRQAYPNSFVMMRLGDFMDWFGDLPEADIQDYVGE